jgi:predicted DNA-binding protein (UPF0251 family)
MGEHRYESCEASLRVGYRRYRKTTNLLSEGNLSGIGEEALMWRGRHRYGRRGRFPKPVTLGTTPSITNFTPNPLRNLEPIFVEFAEVEAFRLVDMEGLSQEEAGQKMSISRGTIWRLIQSARKKVAQALSEGRPIYIVTSTPSKDVQNDKEIK